MENSFQCHSKWKMLWTISSEWETGLLIYISMLRGHAPTTTLMIMMGAIAMDEEITEKSKWRKTI